MLRSLVGSEMCIRDRLFPTNTLGEISAADLRTIVEDIGDTFQIIGEANAPSASVLVQILSGNLPYSALTGRPNLFSGRYADLQGKPSLFSGAFSDLQGRPSGNAYVPTTGTTGYVLTKTAAGRAWQKLPWGVRTLTQAQYDALPSIEPDVIYFTRD